MACLHFCLEVADALSLLGRPDFLQLHHRGGLGTSRSRDPLPLGLDVRLELFVCGRAGNPHEKDSKDLAVFVKNEHGAPSSADIDFSPSSTSDTASHMEGRPCARPTMRQGWELPWYSGTRVLHEASGIGPSTSTSTSAA